MFVLICYVRPARVDAVTVGERKKITQHLKNASMKIYLAYFIDLKEQWFRIYSDTQTSTKWHSLVDIVQMIKNDH